MIDIVLPNCYYSHDVGITPRERVKAESIFKKTTTTPPRPVSTRGIILTPVEVRISKEAQKILQKQEKLRKLQEQQEIQKKLEEEVRFCQITKYSLLLATIISDEKNNNACSRAFRLSKK